MDFETALRDFKKDLSIEINVDELKKKCYVLLIKKKIQKQLQHYQ